MLWLKLTFVTALFVTPLAWAQAPVLQQNFDNPASVEEFWLSNNPSAKRLVNLSDGADCFHGNCLRGNWYQNYLDPITRLQTADSVACRYSHLNIVLPGMGITDEMYLDYRAYVDPDAHKDYGAKWVWIEGTNVHQDYYNHNFNHIIQAPWGGWDTWRIATNNTSVGEGGASGNRVAALSQNACIQTKRGSLSVDDWFQGRWHRFGIYIHLNVPASASNGVFRLYIDECLILDVNDYKYRDIDEDLLRMIGTPFMYGGGEPPPGTFGWQIDDVKLYTIQPGADISPPAAPSGLRVQ